MKRALALVLAASTALAGCGGGVSVITEPRAAEVWVDGKLAGTGSVAFRANGLVGNTYRVEAREPGTGVVLAAQDVDVRFGGRSIAFATVGLFGIIFWPLLPLLPVAFFVGTPEPDHVALHVRAGGFDEREPGEPIDRPFVTIASPKPGVTLHEGVLVVTGRARHWSGLAAVFLVVDGVRVADAPLTPESSGTDEAFELKAPLAGRPGYHFVRVVARPNRGTDGSEAIRIAWAPPGEPAPPPPERVPGLEDK